MTNNICPVCGYAHLDKAAYWENNPNGSASYEICPCCGYQYGYTDDALHISFEQWRLLWIQKGMVFDNSEIGPPPNWNPRAQLLNVGVTV